MSSRTSKTAARIFAFLLLVTVISSCNRGVGCPNNDFSITPTFILPFNK